MEDYLWWKMTFDGRRPSMEDGLWWKTTFGGRWPLVEDDLWWKMTFSGRRPSVEDDLWLKTTFDGGRPVVEDNLRWKTTFNGRWPLLDPCMLPTPLCGIFCNNVYFWGPWTVSMLQKKVVKLGQISNLEAVRMFWIFFIFRLILIFGVILYVFVLTVCALNRHCTM